MSARKGISMTAVVNARAAIIAPKRTKLCVPRVNIEWRCERILYEWNISAMDIVRKAIVIPQAFASAKREASARAAIVSSPPLVT